MWGGLPPPSFLVVCFVWASVVWAGLEGVSRTEAAAGWPCAVCVGLVGCGVVWCRKHACLWWVAAAVVVVVVCCGGCSLVRAGVRVWGWHAVGVLGQCALVAWPVLLLPVGGGVWVWVGWL